MTRRRRLFIASPGDVGDEKTQLDSVVLRFNQRHENRVRVDVHSYDRDMAPDLRRAQDVALRDTRFYECDIVVVLLKHRLGTPTGAADPVTKEPYPSGTAEEIAEARRRQASGEPLRVMVYVCGTAPDPMPARGTPAAAQYESVRAYVQRLRDEHLAIASYDDEADFRAAFERDLDTLLVEPDPEPRDGGAGPKSWLCCDRRPHVGRLDDALAIATGPRTEPPLAYLICGLDSDRPQSLATRLLGELTSRLGQHVRAKPLVLDVPGIDPDDEAPLAPEDLGLKWVRMIHGEFDRSFARVEPSIPALLRTSAFRHQQAGMIVLDHTVRLKRPAQWNATLRDALRWYLTRHWNQYPAGGPAPRHPTVVLLVTVLCPDGMRDSEVHDADNRRVMLRDVRRDLKVIADEDCAGCRRVLLPRLSLVDRWDVLDWFRDHRVHETEPEWNRLISRHFGEAGEFEKPMAVVEDKLFDIYTEHRAVSTLQIA